ncbi:hypothetical protein NHP190003_08930 [Helicobacter sp. NHP19-003]|uniref:Periplasmic protein n=1 Tax=Helicobacter gastrocanis TaxID=2849641 RepID=A0ABN6I1Y9_9HELI|nr:hypothetical protein [Helicobacter sp. NHP19-003]BCZ17611.1 hypothetical protein NHP190003_08930 [Helicobacter sp. NHP19-003]
MKIAKFRAFVLWFVVAVALCVAGFLGYKMYLSKKHHKPHTAYEEHSIHTPKENTHLEAHPKQEQGLKEVFIQSLHETQPHMATDQDHPFLYPSLEKKVGIEFLENTPTRKILVKNLDNYKLFCLQEILKTERIDFAMDRKKTGTTLIIYLPNATEQFLEDLKYYQIPYQLD